MLVVLLFYRGNIIGRLSHKPKKTKKKTKKKTVAFILNNKFMLHQSNWLGEGLDFKLSIYLNKKKKKKKKNKNKKQLLSVSLYNFLILINTWRFWRIPEYVC